MAFVNEKIIKEDREKYLKSLEFFISYYPMNWTIDREDTSILFNIAIEREDMFDPQLEEIYGEYVGSKWVFIYKEVCMKVRFLQPKKNKNQNIKIFKVLEIQILAGQVLNLKEVLDKLQDAMRVRKGYGISLPKNENYDVEVDFREYLYEVL